MDRFFNHIYMCVLFNDAAGRCLNPAHRSTEFEAASKFDRSHYRQYTTINFKLFKTMDCRYENAFDQDQ